MIYNRYKLGYGGKFMNVDINTKLVGLLGYPLGHSLSPLMQNTAFKHYSLNDIYIPIEVLPKDLEAVVKGISKMNFDGFNVTIPYKVDIIKYLDTIDDYAKYIGAVNTVVIEDGKLKGYNTDGIGFLRSFNENTKSSIEGKEVFVLGSGGASRAISMTLALNKVERIYICNRTYEKAVDLAEDINSQVGNISKPVHMEYEEMKKIICDIDVLINTTSVGMYPDIEATPLDRRLLNEDLIVCDIVYNPKKTKLLTEAEKIGCKIVMGLDMLVYQGVESFELWTKAKAPVDLIFKVLKQELDK